MDKYPIQNKYPINWTHVIQEAKATRLKERMNQEEVATLAGISIRIVSNFENNKDVKLSSAIKILSILGLFDQRTLDFPDKEAYYISHRMAVMFWAIGSDPTRRVTQKLKCEIPHIILCDPAKINGNNSIKIFKSKRCIIEQEARRKYLASEFEDDGSILISRDDLFSIKMVQGIGFEPITS